MAIVLYSKPQYYLLCAVFTSAEGIDTLEVEIIGGADAVMFGGSQNGVSPGIPRPPKVDHWKPETWGGESQVADTGRIVDGWR